MTLDAQILRLLTIIPGGTAEAIAEDLTSLSGALVTQCAVQERLHALDDAGRVIMRNGFYRLSEAERARA